MRVKKLGGVLSMIATTATSSAAASAPRVLSIQSHVVHGCVGNRAAVFPLQLLGIETDVLNTVQYSNHVGYGSFAGEKLSGDQVWALLQGMQANGLLAPTRLLTGYMGSAEAVRAVVRALPLLEQNSPDFQFWCDPVLGDNGRLYVPAALVDVYRDEVVPRAHALLPNQFEAEVLSGVTIRTADDARKACAVLHRKGVNLVMITSSQLASTAGGVPDVSAGSSGTDAAAAERPPLTVLLSRKAHRGLWRREYRIDVAQLPQHFAGTGDLLAALLLGWDAKSGAGVPPHVCLRRALAGVQAVLQQTIASAPPQVRGEDEGYGTGTRPLGLRLLESIDAIRQPDEASVAAPVRLDEPLRGVLFDMDGTLTLPGQLDFAQMREAAGLPTGANIIEVIEAMTDPAEKAAAWAAIERVELDTYANVKLQPGMATLIKELRRRGVKVGVATRNHAKAVDVLVEAAGLPPGSFHPVLTREGPYPDKPHPAIACAAAEAWGLPPEACLFVGDSLDDMRCGRAANMVTCHIGAADEEGPMPSVDALQHIDFSIDSLHELTAMLEDAVQQD